MADSPDWPDSHEPERRDTSDTVDRPAEPAAGPLSASALPAGEVYDWYVRGRDLLAGGDADAAVQVLSHTVAAEPQSHSAREMLARAQFDSRRYAEAAQNFGQLVSRDPSDHYAHFGLGLASRRIGDLDVAVEHLALGRRDESGPASLHSRAAGGQGSAQRRDRCPFADIVKGTQGPLAERYDVALLDLDGVVYRGQQPVEHAAEALAAARRSGMRLAFVTNNALRPPDEVARRIQAAGGRRAAR